jgi:outer membrane biosynthesis protein TonB
MPSKNKSNEQNIVQHNPGGEFTRWDITKGEGKRQNNRKTAAVDQKMMPNTGPRKNIGTKNVLDQNDYSAIQAGEITLSTYRWEWAGYINRMKTKLYEVWRTPPAYYMLGMIYGNTMIRVTINREGNMLNSTVLEHKGHQSLQESSENAVENMFPLPRLPVNFPDDSLVITLNLIYPNLKPRSN